MLGLTFSTCPMEVGTCSQNPGKIEVPLHREKHYKAAHLDGDVLVALCNHHAHWWRLKVCVLKPIVHCPQRVLHLHTMTNAQLVGGLTASRKPSKDEAAASDPSLFGYACAVKENTLSCGTYNNAAEIYTV